SFSGTNTQGFLDINLPPGLTIDSSIDTTNFATVLGEKGILGPPTTTYSLAVLTNGTSNSVRVAVVNVNTDDGGISLDPATYNSLRTDTNFPVTNASGHIIKVTFKVPIQGWSSNVVMSSDTSGRSIVLRATKTTGSHTASGTAQDVTGWDANPEDT